jgi:hypothetical protein
VLDAASIEAPALRYWEKKVAAALAAFIASLQPKPQQLHLPKLNARTRMTTLESNATFGWHFGPRFPLQPLRHLGGVGIDFAFLPLREVDCVHAFAVEYDGDFRALGREGHAVPFAGGCDGTLGRGLMAEKGTAAPVGGLFLPWLGTVVADLNFDARGHPVGFDAVGSGLELELEIACIQPRHLRRALNHARERVRQLWEVESELGVRLEIGSEGTAP